MQQIKQAPITRGCKCCALPRDFAERRMA
jgi:hypothetical protein